MAMHSKRVAVLALTAAVAASFAQTRTGEIVASGDDKVLRSHPAGQAQSRTDLMQSARTQKEANLTRWANRIAERVIEESQNSLRYGLLTGEAHGLGV